MGLICKQKTAADSKSTVTGSNSAFIKFSKLHFKGHWLKVLCKQQFKKKSHKHFDLIKSWQNSFKSSKSYQDGLKHTEIKNLEAFKQTETLHWWTLNDRYWQSLTHASLLDLIGGKWKSCFLAVHVRVLTRRVGAVMGELNQKWFFCEEQNQVH